MECSVARRSPGGRGQRIFRDGGRRIILAPTHRELRQCWHVADNNTGHTLVVGPSWVGDMVMAQTLFKILKQQRPEAAIDVLAPAWSEPLLARMPEVREAMNLPFGHGELKFQERMAFGRQLKKRGYKRAYVLPNSLKSALIPYFADIPDRIGWRGEMRYVLLNDIRLLNKKRYPLMIERFAALAYPVAATLPDPLPRPELRVAADDAARIARDRGLPGERPVLALCPGAEFGPSKRWPSSSYAEVARQMIERGWQVRIFGSANDAPVADEILALLPDGVREHGYNLAGKTTLADAIDLLSLSSAVVSNDSGLMHIAAALGLPLVVVYGSTSPGFTPPLAARAEILTPSVKCSPCFKRECPLTRADEHMRCMADTSPLRVVDALQRLVAVGEGARG